MVDNDPSAEKRIVERLNYGSKTAKRVGWEAWNLAVEAPHHVRVTNASYGYEKDEHSYLVTVEERDGLPVPTECECPADEYNEEYACKHRVSSATVGGLVVLQTAMNHSTPTVETEGRDSKTLEERLRADGGLVTEENRDDDGRLIADDREECQNGQKGCPGPDGDSLPCFACYELSEER